MANIFHYIYFRLLKWSHEVTVPRREKCIICVAPHTSNWDFIIGELYFHGIERRAMFLMKRFWFFWPLGVLLRKMGGIPVQRTKQCSLTDHLAAEAIKRDEFVLAVTPEGTRSKVEQWKRGFYYIAQKAQIPIQLYAIDYARKRIVCTQEIVPSERVETDMRAIMAYYAQYSDAGKYPEQFIVESQ